MQLPTKEERRSILILKLAEEQVSDDILDRVATNSETMSGSDLAELVRRASALRLQDQCKDAHFKSQLEFATCIKDVYPLMGLTLKHFNDALIAMGISIDSDEELIENDEDLPPETL
jgi:SpoVK/Ycf46/Vps4 family AAA+-type ATPase